MHVESYFCFPSSVTPWVKQEESPLSLLPHSPHTILPVGFKCWHPRKSFSMGLKDLHSPLYCASYQKCQPNSSVSSSPLPTFPATLASSMEGTIIMTFPVIISPLQGQVLSGKTTQNICCMFYHSQQGTYKFHYNLCILLSCCATFRDFNTYSGPQKGPPDTSLTF